MNQLAPVETLIQLSPDCATRETGVGSGGGCKMSELGVCGDEEEHRSRAESSGFTGMKTRWLAICTLAVKSFRRIFSKTMRFG